jgi:hypothetical protein
MKKLSLKTYFKILVATLALVGLAQVDSAFASNCSPAPGGDETITASCSFAKTVDGVDNGNVVLNSGDLTINSNQTFVFNPGFSIIKASGARIIKGTGAVIKKTYIWETGTVNSYPTTSQVQVAQDTSPGAGYVRRYQLTSQFCQTGSCPTACGQPASTQPNGADGSGTCITQSCAATAPCYTQGYYYAQGYYYTQGYYQRYYYTQGYYYAQGYYYTQGYYYAQGYYYTQGYYQGYYYTQGYYQGYYYTQGYYYAQGYYYTQGYYYAQGYYYTQGYYYGQGYYYTQGYYYGQGYYQGFYYAEGYYYTQGYYYGQGYYFYSESGYFGI